MNVLSLFVKIKAVASVNAAAAQMVGASPASPRSHVHTKPAASMTICPGSRLLFDQACAAALSAPAASSSAGPRDACPVQISKALTLCFS